MTCKECKYWYKRSISTTGGLCTKIVNDPYSDNGKIAWVTCLTDDGHTGVFYTLENFSCSLFKLREI